MALGGLARGEFFPVRFGEMVGEMIEGILPPFSHPLSASLPSFPYSLHLLPLLLCFSSSVCSSVSEHWSSSFSWSFVSVFVVSFFLFFYTDLSPYSEVGSFGEILLGVYSYVLFFLIL